MVGNVCSCARQIAVSVVARIISSKHHTFSSFSAVYMAFFSKFSRRDRWLGS